MAEEQPKATNCPNCQQPAIRSGNEITCENCDATFVITKKQGAKVKQVGAIDEIRARVDALEAKAQGDEPAEPVEPVEDETEEPIL